MNENDASEEVKPGRQAGRAILDAFDDLSRNLKLPLQGKFLGDKKMVLLRMFGVWVYDQWLTDKDARVFSTPYIQVAAAEARRQYNHHEPESLKAVAVEIGIDGLPIFLEE